MNWTRPLFSFAPCSSFEANIPMLCSFIGKQRSVPQIPIPSINDVSFIKTSTSFLHSDRHWKSQLMILLFAFHRSYNTVTIKIRIFWSFQSSVFITPGQARMGTLKESCSFDTVLTQASIQYKMVLC